MIKQFLGKSDFAKNVMTLLTGTAIAQLMGVLLSPVLSRIYSPSDFGFFAVFMSVVSGIALIACGRFELAIMLPREHKDADDVASLAYKFCLTTSTITTVVVLLLLLFNVIDHKIYLTYGLIVFAIGAYQININLANRHEKYRLIATSRIINSVANLAGSILLGLTGILSLGLVIANVVSQFAANLTFGVNKLNPLKKTFKELSPVFTRYKHFLQFNTLQALSDLYMVNAVYYLLPLFFSNTVLGLYGFAIRILQAPMSLIGSSIAAVFYQRSSEYHNKSRSSAGLIKSTILRSAIIALPIPIVLFFSGPQLFAFVFGEQWREAGAYARILSPWLYFDFIRATISQFPIVVNRQKKLFLITLCGNLLLTILLLFLGWQGENVKLVFELVSALMSIYALFIIIWIYNLGKNYPSESLTDV